MNENDWSEAMEKITAAWLTSPIGSYIQVGTIQEPTLKDKISNIPYNIMYYSIRPLAWLIRELWHGLHDGWSDIWDD